MPKRKQSLKAALAEFLENFDEDDDEGGEDDDVITLRGPSARALLGILGGDEGKPAGDGGEGKPAGDGEGEPAGEPAPQRGQSRYFGGDK